MPEAPHARRDRITALVAGVLLALALPTLWAMMPDAPDGDLPRGERFVWFVAFAVGAVVPFLYWSPYRALGLVPFAAVGWLAAVAHGVYWNEWPGWAHGPFPGLIAGGLVRGRRGAGPTTAEYWVGGGVIAGFGIAVAVTRGTLSPAAAGGYLVLAVSVALVLWAWARLFRPAFELANEPLLWVMYNVRGRGPGLANFPRTGPCLVLANHACWFDPLFLAKVLPRPVTPMMTARFYDLPVIHRLVVAFGVIRVPEKALKKEAPEIEQAVAALDRGECVVVFPEGYLRRGEDKPLRRFGQGVWQILLARPDTPVFAAWIEGAWGSYTSYFNGRPTKNKRPDFRRRIGIGVSAAATIPPEVLAEHLRTRIHLMNLVAAAREHLTLPPLPPFELPAREETTDEAAAG